MTEKPEPKKSEKLEPAVEETLPPSEEPNKSLPEEISALSLDEPKPATKVDLVSDEPKAEASKADDKKLPKVSTTSTAGAKDYRPGTTKRRQYYYKKVADCLEVDDSSADRYHLYSLQLQLSCAIPDDQNTRGRSIFDPVRFGLIALLGA